MGTWVETLLKILMIATAAFLILLVLVQRGRGGGLAGAFGGMGGQSAFGTKAGDLFTRITIGVAFFWILLCLGADKYCGARRGSQVLDPSLTDKTQQVPSGTPVPKNPGAETNPDATKGEATKGEAPAPPSGAGDATEGKAAGEGAIKPAAPAGGAESAPPAGDAGAAAEKGGAPAAEKEK